MAMEILDAFGQLTREKAIDKSEVIELVKAGMLAAVRRNHGARWASSLTLRPAIGTTRRENDRSGNAAT